MTITEFLEARIAEDEQVARGTIGTHWGHAFQQVRTECGDDPHYYKIASGQVGLEHWEPTRRLDPGTTFQHIAHHDPARVLAECAAKRAVIKSYQSCQHAENEARKDISRDVQKFGVKLVASGMVKGLELAVKYLAATYHTHPEYERDWADETIRSMRDHQVIPHHSDSGQEK